MIDCSGSLQERLLLAIQTSKDNAINSKARNIKLYQVNAVEEIKINQSLRFMPDQLIKEIQRRCVKNAGDNPVMKGSTVHAPIDVMDEEAVERVLARHNRVVTEMKDRIQHDFELAIEQIGLLPSRSATDVPNEGAEEDDGDDFYVEEKIPQATVIRHKKQMHAFGASDSEPIEDMRARVGIAAKKGEDLATEVQMLRAQVAEMESLRKQADELERRSVIVSELNASLTEQARGLSLGKADMVEEIRALKSRGEPVITRESELVRQLTHVQTRLIAARQENNTRGCNLQSTRGMLDVHDEAHYHELVARDQLIEKLRKKAQGPGRSGVTLDQLEAKVRKEEREAGDARRKLRNVGSKYESLKRKYTAATDRLSRAQNDLQQLRCPRPPAQATTAKAPVDPRTREIEAAIAAERFRNDDLMQRAERAENELTQLRCFMNVSAGQCPHCSAPPPLPNQRRAPVKTSSSSKKAGPKRPSWMNFRDY